MHAALNFSQQIRAPAVQHTRRAVNNSRYRTITRAAAMEITVRIRFPVLRDLFCQEMIVSLDSHLHALCTYPTVLH